jgi:hypothetical protein
MSAQITLTNATFNTTPATNQIVTVKYRLGSDPDVDASYTTVTTTAPITPAGVFSPPVVISGLLNGTAYVVKVINNCNGSFVNKPFTTPLPTCVNLTDIVGSTATE